jgi:hypothetical protein
MRRTDGRRHSRLVPNSNIASGNDMKGDTCRHMFWSQPKPCEKTIAFGPVPTV